MNSTRSWEAGDQEPELVAEDDASMVEGAALSTQDEQELSAPDSAGPDLVEQDSAEHVNYDSDPVLEVTIEDTEYRLDAGKQGTALCVSQREPGSWDWHYLEEAKWDGMSLRCRPLARPLREALAKALKRAMQEAV